ncbi:hypothetical protein A2335_02955 [Candidatus Peregrinibacteria bacterium RIFOXYB2_FULL_32_7]|nr:MAG: hypothetical protein A2335_02955 [Candidatus Peregrinibacteria bacterium RIFOXYB2_FULL_32_7]OGY87418.1 MAG: hypothetical protein A2233_00690 [Candidatus Kerfeldbacteria bacterium RIFOXYA2_FULL_38_24]
MKQTDDLTLKFNELNTHDLAAVLGLTIKKDEENKIVTFLCQLSAYTDNSQFNVSYNAPSSTGKSYIPTEIARLFPPEDVMELAYCSPTAFFHDNGKYDKTTNTNTINLSRKIIIFLDQPHTELLARMRPLLSHDKKEIVLKITDKNDKNGMRTKNILMIGYPSVIFCTAGMRIDEQESTRFILLSPEIDQEKIRQGISATIKRESDNALYDAWLAENAERKLLKERIIAIKKQGIEEIKISAYQSIEDRFFTKSKILKPRHQRDIKRLISIIKSIALLNLWWRERNGNIIFANDSDITQAFDLWEKISVSQELNLPPYVYHLYKEVVLTAWYEKNMKRFGQIIGRGDTLGLTRQEILQKHFNVYGRMMDGYQLRQQILPMLEMTGLIIQEQDQQDKRKVLIYPTTQMMDFLKNSVGAAGEGK